MPESNSDRGGPATFVFGDGIRLDVVIPKGVRVRFSKVPRNDRLHNYVKARLRGVSKLIHSMRPPHWGQWLAIGSRVRGHRISARSNRRSSRRRVRVLRAAKRATADPDPEHPRHKRGDTTGRANAETLL